MSDAKITLTYERSNSNPDYPNKTVTAVINLHGGEVKSETLIEEFKDFLRSCDYVIEYKE